MSEDTKAVVASNLTHTYFETVVRIRNNDNAEHGDVLHQPPTEDEVVAAFKRIKTKLD